MHFKTEILSEITFVDMSQHIGKIIGVDVFYEGKWQGVEETLILAMDDSAVVMLSDLPLLEHNVLERLKTKGADYFFDSAFYDDEERDIADIIDGCIYPAYLKDGKMETCLGFELKAYQLPESQNPKVAQSKIFDQ